MGEGLHSQQGAIVERDRKRRIRQSGASVEEAARAMRRAPTPAESALWRGIRKRHRGGLKFRRQHPHGRFVLDFCCPELKLVIEVDGGVHESQRQRDACRTAALEAEGYRVIRFDNKDVLHHLPWVLDRIDEVVASLRTETPLPFMGEGGEPKRAG
jgi:very-short-patch-repair endonuclease